MPVEMDFVFGAFVTQQVNVSAQFFNAADEEEIPGSVPDDEFPSWSCDNLSVATINVSSANASSILVTPTGVVGVVRIFCSWKGLQKSAQIDFQDATHQPVRMELSFWAEPLPAPAPAPAPAPSN